MGEAFLNGKRRAAQAEQAADVAVTDLPRGQINHARHSTAHAQVWPDKSYRHRDQGSQGNYGRDDRISARTRIISRW